MTPDDRLQALQHLRIVLEFGVETVSRCLEHAGELQLDATALMNFDRQRIALIAKIETLLANGPDVARGASSQM